MNSGESMPYLRPCLESGMEHSPVSLSTEQKRLMIKSKAPFNFKCGLQDMIFVTAADLQQGSPIVGAKGQPLTIVAVKEEPAYQLVELVRNDTRFLVTATHRMVGDPSYVWISAASIHKKKKVGVHLKKRQPANPNALV